jgi:hypothetical protein
MRLGGGPLAAGGPLPPFTGRSIASCYAIPYVYVKVRFVALPFRAPITALVI